MTYTLIARVRPKDEATYLAYLRDVYYPAVSVLPGFVSLRIVKWRPTMGPSPFMEGEAVEFVRASTWTSRETAEAYFAHPVRSTFGKLLEMAEVLAYGGGDVVVDLGPSKKGA